MSTRQLRPKLSLQTIEGKDLGVMATATIARGERVLEESPLFKVQRRLLPLEKGVGRKHAEAEVRKRIKKIPEDDQAAFWEMADCHKGKAAKTAIGICRTNNFSLNAEPDTLGAFPLGGRFNHSCRPNVVWYWSEQPGAKMVFHATREIQAGEELCISYCTLEDITAERRARLKESHRFLCKCEACTLTGPDREKSDRLRIELRELSQQVQRLAAPEPRKALETLERVFELIDQELGGELWMRARAKNDAFHAAIFARDLPLAGRTMQEAIDAWLLAGGESDKQLLAEMRGYAKDPASHRLWCLGARHIWRGAKGCRARSRSR